MERARLIREAIVEHDFVSGPMDKLAGIDDNALRQQRRYVIHTPELSTWGPGVNRRASTNLNGSVMASRKVVLTTNTRGVVVDSIPTAPFPYFPLGPEPM